uniref:Chromo domain-containing protein n=1 Tax=Strigamia maritima TaxID=126957 RepID=T1IPN5_STRMM
MSDDEFEVEEILTSRIRNKQSEYLVRWKGYGSDSDTWEPAVNLLNCPEILDRFNATRDVKKNYSTKKRAPELKRSNSRSRSRSRSQVKPDEVMINGAISDDKHSVVAELVKSSLDISPRGFKEVAGRYPTIKEIKSYATQRSYQKLTTDTAHDQVSVSDDEVDDGAPSHHAKSQFHLGKYLFVFSGVVCGFAIIWAECGLEI